MEDGVVPAGNLPTVMITGHEIHGGDSGAENNTDVAVEGSNENSGGGEISGRGGEDEEEDRVIDLLMVDEAGGSILELCGGYLQGLTRVHCCTSCDAHIHVLCGDMAGEEVP